MGVCLYTTRKADPTEGVSGGWLTKCRPPKCSMVILDGVVAFSRSLPPEVDVSGLLTLLRDSCDCLRMRVAVLSLHVRRGNER